MTKKQIRNIIQFGLTFFASYGILWQIIEPVLGLMSLKTEGFLPYMVFVIISIVIAYFTIPKNKILLKVNTSEILIQEDDLFNSKGCKVISVNEYFDSELGDLVSPNSLHGKFITLILGGQSDSFDSLVNKSLEKEKFVKIERDRGKKRKYPIGTTAIVESNQIKYFLFALCQTEIETNKAFASKNNFKVATEKLLEKIRIGHNGSEVNIPLYGTGLSGVDLNPQQVLNFLITSIKLSDKMIAKKINIIIHKSMIKEIPLCQRSCRLG